MKRQRCIDDVGAHLADEEGKLVPGRVQVVRQDGAVDGEQGLLAWKTDGEGCEMALEKNEINIRLFDFYNN